MYTKIKLINFQNELVTEAWILTFTPPADVVVFGQRVFVITNIDNTYKELFVTAALMDIPRNLMEGVHVVVDGPPVEREGNAGNDQYLAGIPTTMDEAVETLIGFYSDVLVDIEAMDESEFQASSHHSAGQFIRNSWCLWWYEKHDCIKWPKSRPGIVAEFNKIGIVHADDMTGIILTLVHRKIRNKPADVDELVKVCQDHWKKEGFADGIPK